MKCNETRKWISPYLDSELGHTKTFEVSEHLANCPECSRRFESERGADDLMRSRLETESMPADQWASFSSDLSRPAWVRRLTSRPALSMAASLLFVVALTVSFFSLKGSDSTPWLAKRFATVALENEPFPEDASESRAAASLLASDFGLLLVRSASAKTTDEHFDLQLLSANWREDDQGNRYAEVRLNCCGQPVLLALRRSPGGGSLATVGDVSRFDGVNVASVQIADVSIVASSRHFVTHILDSFQQIKA